MASKIPFKISLFPAIFDGDEAYRPKNSIKTSSAFVYIDCTYISPNITKPNDSIFFYFHIITVQSL